MINNSSNVLDSGAFAPESNTPIRAENISKRFGATQALDNVSIELIKGEVHAFAGENGAGKSTLGKIISGLYTPDSGELFLDNQLITKWGTAKAQKSGVVLIAQELSLVPKLSVAENVFLGVESHRLGVLSGNTKDRFNELEAITNFGINPNAQVDSLRLADRQKVEILRALAREARVIIMDEPTSSLTSDEVEKFHAAIRVLTAQGRTIIYITHFLESLLETSDRVTILRDGRLVKTSETRNETKNSLVESMLGRSIDATFPARSPKPVSSIAPRLQVHELCGKNGTKNVSFEIGAGEIVGLAGLVGSGRSEIARLIFGADPISSGQVILNGVEITKFSPSRSVKNGIVLIPEDRRSQGLVLVRSVKENVVLPHLNLVSNVGVVNPLKETETVKRFVQKVKVTPPKIKSPVMDFSGGNQQKVLLAKWIMGNPTVIIFDEPTRGVDIGAKVHIYETITKLAQDGAAILLISSEHEEVMALCHRVYLVRDGGLIGEMDPLHHSVDDVLLALFDLTKEKRDGVAD